MVSDWLGSVDAAVSRRCSVLVRFFGAKSESESDPHGTVLHVEPYEETELQGVITNQFDAVTN
jgi:hypothetical protein